MGSGPISMVVSCVYTCIVGAVLYMSNFDKGFALFYGAAKGQTPLFHGGITQLHESLPLLGKGTYNNLKLVVCQIDKAEGCMGITALAIFTQAMVALAVLCCAIDFAIGFAIQSQKKDVMLSLRCLAPLPNMIFGSLMFAFIFGAAYGLELAAVDLKWGRLDQLVVTRFGRGGMILCWTFLFKFILDIANSCVLAGHKSRRRSDSDDEEDDFIPLPVFGLAVPNFFSKARQPLIRNAGGPPGMMGVMQPTPGGPRPVMPVAQQGVPPRGPGMMPGAPMAAGAAPMMGSPMRGPGGPPPHNMNQPLRPMPMQAAAGFMPQKF